jgi:Na+-transporting NADH:ubiquinone oxidoreductase subunit C
MKNNPIYTVAFVLVLGCVCALFLTWADQHLGPLTDINKELDHKKAVLQAVHLIELEEKQGIVKSVLQSIGLVEAGPEGPSDAEVVALFDECIKETGEGQYEAYNKKKELVGYARNLEFYGFEDIVRGVVACNKDKTSLLGMTIYEHRETPGKGAKIETVAWLEKFRGLSLEVADDDNQIFISSKRTGANIVERDTVSGASRTVSALEHELNVIIALMRAGTSVELLDIEKLVLDVKSGPTPYPITSEKQPKIMRPKDYTKRPPYMLPQGFTNIALNKPVTTNVEPEAIQHNTLKVITDGDFNSMSPKSFVGLQNWGQTPYVQIDLGQMSTIYTIGVWHYFPGPVYTDVIVQVSDDKDFKKNVHTLFNNDFDGSTYKDPDRKKLEDFNWCYPASKFGELVPDKKDLKSEGWKGRYVRVYSDKAFYEEGMEARFVEIAVWGVAGEVVKFEPELLDIEKLVADVKSGPTPYPNTSEKQPKKLRPKDYTKRPAYLLSQGFKNLALNKPVTTNVEPEAVQHNSLKVVTDGDYNSKSPKSFVGLQNWGETPYVQIDLGKVCSLYTVGVWHYFPGPIYTDVIIQTANDKDFKTNLKTIYNNDFDGSTYKDPDRKTLEDFNWCYPASKFGELAPAKKDLKPGGWKGRYVRVYSDKAFYEEGMEARFVEISVWGKED